MFSKIIKGLNLYKLSLFFLSFLLVWKWKCVLTILDHQFRLFKYWIFFSFPREKFVNIYSYDIHLDSILWVDLILYQNLFMTTFVIINILLLLYTQSQVFYNWREIYCSYSHHKFTWLFFFFIIFFLFVNDIYLIHSDIWNYDYLINVIKSEHLIKDIVLEPFYYRFFLIFIYKVLTIYVAFGIKNNHLAFKLLFWFLISYLLRSNEFISALIVDGTLAYLIINPTLDALNNAKGGFYVYFDALVCYCSPIKPTRLVKLDSLKKVVDSFAESDEEYLQKQNKCSKHLKDLLNSSNKNFSIGENLTQYYFPLFKTPLENLKYRDIGESCEEHALAFTKCMEEPTFSLNKESKIISQKFPIQVPKIPSTLKDFDISKYPADFESEEYQAKLDKEFDLFCQKLEDGKNEKK